MLTDFDTSSLLTLTDSLRPALYRFKGKRRYQAVNPEYSWPCDDTGSLMEILLADLGEKIYPNRLHHEPKVGAMDALLSRDDEGPPRILDLGNGTTARWCISMAERYSHADVYGIDLVPSDLPYLPPNLTIEVADVLEGLPYPDDFFGLVHCRLPCGEPGVPSFFEHPTTNLLADVARVLRPGGVLLLEDVDNLRTPFHADDPKNPYVSLANARQALRWRGAYLDPLADIVPSWGTRMGAEVRHAGHFQDVMETSYQIPIGARPVEGQPEDQTGCLNREAWLMGAELQGAVMGWGEARIQRERRGDERALPVEDVGLYSLWSVVWAVRSVDAADEA